MNLTGLYGPNDISKEFMDVILKGSVAAQHSRLFQTPGLDMTVPVYKYEPEDTWQHYGTYDLKTIRTKRIGIRMRVSSDRLIDDEDRAVHEACAYMAAKMRREVDRAWLFGDGVTGPLGIANSPHTTTIARECDDSNRLSKADLYNVYDRLDKYSNANALLVNSHIDAAELADIFVPEAAPFRSKDVSCLNLMGMPVITTGVQPGLHEDGGLIAAKLDDYVLGIAMPTLSTFDDHERWTRNITFTMDIGGTMLGQTRTPWVSAVMFECPHCRGQGKPIIVCKTCGFAWPAEQVKCWDGYNGCGASLQDPGAASYILCHSCGRVWPDVFEACWDGVDGCGGKLGGVA